MSNLSDAAEAISQMAEKYSAIANANSAQAAMDDLKKTAQNILG